jgi:iron(III) transport system substrate-binding protein
MNWKIFVLTVLLISLSISVFAASTQLINAAKKEGKVVIYSITSRIANAAAAFEKKYGIKVEAYDLHDYELVEKVSKEVRS